MIAFFPLPYLDEVFYSTCARYADQMPSMNPKSTMEKLFGSRNVIATIELPSHLEFFSNALAWPEVYTVEKVITDHTMLPMYAPFMPVERLEQIKKDMASNCGMGIHMRSGIMPFSIKSPDMLRYCPHCLIEDRENYGEGYWHRLFQATGNLVCTKHATYLENSGVKKAGNRTRHRFFPIDEVVHSLPKRRDESPSPPQILLDISNDLSWLLTGQPHRIRCNEIQKAYLSLLTQQGFATQTGRLLSDRLQEEFRAFYGPDILATFGCDICGIRDNWLLRLLHKRDCVFPPIRHILFIRFLGLSTKEFFELQPQERESAQHNNQKSCGIFVGNGQEAHHDPAWEKALQQLWNDPLVSLREIGRRLQADHLTIKRHATRMNLSFPRPGRKCAPLPAAKKLRAARDITVFKTKFRIRWEKAIEAHPNAGAKSLRKLEPTTYTWLYRHDRDWLSDHKPKRKQPVHSPRINWALRDQEIAAAIDNAIDMILKSPGRPIQITTAEIGRRIGRLALIQRHINKLPLTDKKIKQRTESREQYAIRRIYWAKEQFRQRGIKPQTWELIKVSGTERLCDVPAIRGELESAAVH